jgi:hypothetical protein
VEPDLPEPGSFLQHRREPQPVHLLPQPMPLVQLERFRQPGEGVERIALLGAAHPVGHVRPHELPTPLLLRPLRLTARRLRCQPLPCLCRLHGPRPVCFPGGPSGLLVGPLLRPLRLPQRRLRLLRVPARFLGAGARLPEVPVGAAGLLSLRERQPAYHRQDARGHRRRARQRPPVGHPLPPQLRVRHVRRHPLPVEHPLVDPVPHPQPAAGEPHHPREPQQIDQRVGVIRRHPLAGSHLGVEIEEAGQVRLAAEQPLPHEQQVVVLLPGADGEEQRGTVLIHARRAAHLRIL